MLRQYNPQRFRHETIGGKVCRVGTNPVGTIFRLPDTPRYYRVFTGFRTMPPVRSAPKRIIEAWLPREIGAGRRGDDGRCVNTYAAGGHLARVRRLYDGKTFVIADHIIRACVDDE